MTSWQQTYSDAFAAFIDRLCGNAPKQPEPQPEPERKPYRRHDWCIGGCEGLERCPHDPVCGN